MKIKPSSSCEQASVFRCCWIKSDVFDFQSRARQEDPEQARLKQKAKEVSFTVGVFYLKFGRFMLSQLSR